MPGANWKDLTPQEKAEWFDSQVKKWDSLAKDKKEKALKEIQAARSRRAGKKRHKKKRWWNH